MGVKINAKTGKNCVRFSFVCRPDVFENVLSLFHDMLEETDYTEDKLLAEIAVVLAETNEIKQTNGEIIIDNSWSNRRYAQPILGDAESLNKIMLKDVVKYKKKLLTAESIVFLTGNFSDAHVALIERLFQSADPLNGTACSDSDSTVEKKPDCEQHKSVVKFIRDEFSVIDVYYTFKLPLSENDREKDIVCAQMIDSVFTQGDAAYLCETLREKYGYVYSVDSDVRVSIKK